MSLLAEKSRVLTDRITSETEAARKTLQEFQRYAFLLFAETVKEHMQPGYRIAAACKGKGMYVRMRAAVQTHIDANPSLFDASTSAVQTYLQTTLVNEVVSVFERAVQEVAEVLKADLVSYKVLPVEALRGRTRAEVGGGKKRYAAGIQKEATRILAGLMEKMRAVLERAEGEASDEISEKMPVPVRLPVVEKSDLWQIAASASDSKVRRRNSL
ncbi:hypothetical protein BJ508DRAFT_128658 [Ascobolus immersus RN42]|uniref:Uncharacterized protein n=1 Tax=Ascobolus immersus RN42 TaxID=1160509 RepID=A0A3N4I374_ASCIM|nr:hypothetical protein BJ508DRAFT_128658 [Ascobolus immersus RN42]